MSKSLYTEVVELPSKGLLYDNIPGGKVTIRCITLADQKFLGGSNMPGSDRVIELLKRCIESPEFDPQELTSIDSFFLLVKLRILSYGGKYTFITRCPDCGKKIEVTMNLSDLTVESLEDDYASKLEVVLPHAGDTVYTKLLINRDEEEISEAVERENRKFKDAGDPEVFIRLAKCIKSIKLKQANESGAKTIEDPILIRKYVEGLTDWDGMAIKSTLENIDYGIQPEFRHVCPECHEEVEIGIRFTPQFFRPKYDL